jgi:site-specific DNA-methyltransferase (cytosine-N4-specific)
MKKTSNKCPTLGRPPDSAAYRTSRGVFFHGDTKEVLKSRSLRRYRGLVDLIFTSPPFPLNRKKKYGNLNGQEYIDWLCSFGPEFKSMLSDSGSIVIEIGNSWEKGAPVMSTLGLKALLQFQEENDLYLCQEFIWHNPARLPSPAQWVNVERVRVKDGFTRLWWLSKTPRPKANNKNVLIEYSKSMQKLLKAGEYNSGKRISEHKIGEKSFLENHGGSISSSVLTYPNTASNDQYVDYCRRRGLTPHPARMPPKLAEFFIKFLTDKNDLVLDPFGGSNTTGQAAENLDRYWLAIEANDEYIYGSKGRFSKVV